MATHNISASSWSYNGMGGFQKIGTFTTSSKQETNIAIILKLGTGDGTFNSGTQAVGYGANVTTIIGLNTDGSSKPDIKSEAKEITNIVTPISYYGGTYPNKDKCKSYRFEFNSEYKLEANTKYTVLVDTPISNSTGVICLDNRNDSSGTVEYDEVDTQKFTLTLKANGGELDKYRYSGTAGTEIKLPKPTKSYKVTFDGNGGTLVDKDKYVYCQFKGWGKSSGSDTVHYNDGYTFKLKENITLYAIWANPKLGSVKPPTRTNCRFKMWANNKDGDTKFDSNSEINKHITLYAIWKYRVFYDGNGGKYYTKEAPNISKQSAEVYIDKGSYKVASVETYPFKTYDNKNRVLTVLKNYTYRSGGNTYTVNPGASININKPVELIAQYSPLMCQVTFVNVLDTAKNKTISVKSGTGIPKKDIPNYYMPGYNNIGWTLNPSGSIDQAIYSNITATAKWAFRVPVLRYNIKTKKWVEINPFKLENPKGGCVWIRKNGTWKLLTLCHIREDNTWN